MNLQIATCIGCGCDDLNACDDGLLGSCAWLIVDRARGLGVCTSCVSHLARYKKGERMLSKGARNALRRRKVAEDARARARKISPGRRRGSRG